MKAILALFLCAVVLAACDEFRPADTADSLLADPQRHRELRAQCKADHARMGDALCNAVAEVTRRRFLGSGTPYTPTPASAASSAPTQGMKP